MGLIPKPGKIAETSEIYFYPTQSDRDRNTDINLVTLNEDEKRQYRGGKIAMIFQEPMSSLNPVYNIGFQITEAIQLHQQVTPEQAKQQAIALLQEVRVLPSDETLEETFFNEKISEKSSKIRLRYRAN